MRLQIISDWLDEDLSTDFIMKLRIIWNLWKARNDIIFSQGNFSATGILKKASQDFKLCQENNSSPNTTQSTRNQQWTPPNLHYVKINVESAFIPNNGSAGAIAQDHHGRFLGCASITFDATSSLLAEARARLNFNKIVVE